MNKGHLFIIGLLLFLISVVFGFSSRFPELQKVKAQADSIPGDINRDGKVDIFDYNLLVSDFGKTTATPADLDKNGKVDIFDYNILVGNFGK